MADPHTDDLADRIEDLLYTQVKEIDGPTWITKMAPLAEEAVAALRASSGEVNDREVAYLDELLRSGRTLFTPTRFRIAAELRRLRHRDAALTTLLDAVGGDAECVRKMALDISDGPENTWAAELTEIELYLRRIAAAVEGIDQEHER